MIQFNKVTKKYRARWNYGHNSYYKKLLKSKKQMDEQFAKLEKKEKEPSATQKNGYYKVIGEIERLENQYGKPVNVTSRRSFNTRHQWQATYAEELFKIAHDLEAEGKNIPRLLHAQINNLVEAPRREDFLEELAFRFASIAGFHEDVLMHSDYEMFLAQSDANTDWILELKITEKEVRNKAKSVCSSSDNLVLKNKKYLFTGSFIGYTACEEYIKCLHNMAKDLKVDGIITAGPWIKYIFLHKTAGSQKVLDSVKRLAKSVPIYAIRSNREDADLIPLLKDIGITFLNKIEDENNVFLNHQFSRMSNKDQLMKFRDYNVEKNIFVHTTYVASEPRLVNDQIKYIVGSGSSSYHTPSARIWAASYDSQHINSEKYDEIGGHLISFDSKSELYSQAFYFNQDLQGVFCNGDVYTSKTKHEGTINIVISDGHFSGVHEKGYTALCQFIKDNYEKINGITFNGDIFDNAVLCHWNDGDYSKQIAIKEKYKSFLHEVAVTRVMIEHIVNLATGEGSRKIDLIYKKGNHELSSFKKLNRKSIVHFLSNMLNLDPLLKLSENGFQIIDGDKPYFINQVPVLHGHEMHRNMAFKNFGRLSTIGHSHRGSCDALGVILPTLEDQEHVDYFSYWKAPWSVGWGVITSFKGVSEKPVNFLVKGSRYLGLRGIKKIGKIIKTVLPKQLDVSYDL